MGFMRSATLLLSARSRQVVFPDHDEVERLGREAECRLCSRFQELWWSLGAAARTQMMSATSSSDVAAQGRS
jgi:hypothetical protein